MHFIHLHWLPDHIFHGLQMKTLLFITLGLLGASAFADSTAGAPTQKLVTKAPISAHQSSALHITANGAAIDGIAVTALGTGVRKRRVLFVNINIYEATIFGSEPASFVRATKGTLALESLTGMKAYGIRLKLLRSLSASQIYDAISDSLRANHVSNSVSMKQFKDAIRNSGDVAKGQYFSIAVNPDKNVLTLSQGHRIAHIQGDRSFFSQVMSIWLGDPANVGKDDLRENLIVEPKGLDGAP
jgi:hypothetical protein